MSTLFIVHEGGTLSTSAIKSGRLSAKLRNRVMLLMFREHCGFRLLLVHVFKNQNGIKIVHCINKILLENIKTSKTFYF